jgi:hypothetical protein
MLHIQKQAVQLKEEERHEESREANRRSLKITQVYTGFVEAVAEIKLDKVRCKELRNRCKKGLNTILQTKACTVPHAYGPSP